jgi:5-methylcytosine-specific restriction enzyme A
MTTVLFVEPPGTDDGGTGGVLDRAGPDCVVMASTLPGSTAKGSRFTPPDRCKNRRMAAIILVWDPDRRDGWNYAAAVERVSETGQFLADWTMTGPNRIPAGTEVWLWLQGRTRCGLLGHGTVVSDARREGHTRISVAFDALIPPGDELPPSLFADIVPDIPWIAPMQPLTVLEPLLEAKIRAVWRGFGPSQPPAPGHLIPGSYPGQAIRRVQVNRFESSIEAQRVCIAHHGTSCAACGLSFEATYGAAGAGFIEVHHLVPPELLGSDYQLDPVADLVPLCSNCHAMAHLGVATPRTVAELRQLIAAAGYLPGQTVTPEELEAQRDARRILEQH